MENASIRPGYPKRHGWVGTRRGGDTEHERMQRIAEYIKYMIIRPPTVKFIELGGGGKSCTGIATKLQMGCACPPVWELCPSAYGLCYRLGLTAIK